MRHSTAGESSKEGLPVELACRPGRLEAQAEEDLRPWCRTGRTRFLSIPPSRGTQGKGGLHSPEGAFRTRGKRAEQEGQGTEQRACVKN